MARNVLLVADAFYPLTLAGAHRVSKLAKFLPQFGWHPIVLCPRWTEQNAPGLVDVALEHDVRSAEVYRVPSPGLSMAMTVRVVRKLESVMWPYAEPISTVRAMLGRARELLRQRRVDAIWSTYNPGYPHLVAGWIARRWGIPWVADFRDLPDQSTQGNRERRLVRAERLVCAAATRLTVTTPVLRDKLAARHRQPIDVIENGFDPDDFPSGPASASPHFTISYFGILYAFRDPRPVFAALDRLSADGKIDLNRVRVRFFGTPPSELLTLSRDYECRRVVSAEPRVGRADLVREQLHSTVLLNLQSAEAGGAVPSKLMEYLGARRMILNVPGDGGPIDAVLANTNAGATARTADEIAAVLERSYAAWDRNGGRLEVSPAPEGLLHYTRQHQAEMFARIFGQVAAGARL